MAQHKAPTQVTIAAVEEKSTFAAFVEKSWKPAALAAVAVIAFVIFRHNKQEQTHKQISQGWNALTSSLGLSFRGIDFSLPPPGDIVADGQKIQGTEAEPWALLVQADALAEDREFGRAKELVELLKKRFPNHPICQQKYTFGTAGSGDGGSSEMTLPDRMLQSLAAQEVWASENPQLFDNPALPADPPRVRVETDEGTFVVGLYLDRAPKHAENFLKLCREGFYDGTRFHRVQTGQFIQGGDPDSAKDDTLAWGKGGPGYKIEKEDSGLNHFEGVLAAAKMGGDEESSGSQFYITARSMHGFDDRYVVYGRVLEGIDVVKKISLGELNPNSDRPVEPAKILSTTVLP